MSAGRQIGLEVSHLQKGSARVSLKIAGRPSQPDAWHTLARLHLQDGEDALIVAVLREGCKALGVPFRGLRETRMTSGEQGRALSAQATDVERATAARRAIIERQRALAEVEIVRPSVAAEERAGLREYQRVRRRTPDLPDEGS